MTEGKAFWIVWGILMLIITLLLIFVPGAGA